MKGAAYLKRKLSIKRERVLLRYKYYDMKTEKLDLGRLVQPDMARRYNSVLGWCGKAVDSLADRLYFEGFDDDVLDVMSIFNANNPDVFFDSAILSALISSCCFVYISDGDDDVPHIQVIDGANATGIIDPTTGLLTEGYAVLDRDSDTDNVLMDAYFTTGQTVITDYTNRVTQTFANSAPAPLLVPIIYRPDAKRPFGHSRISRACMNLTNQARMTLTRANISAEFYSWPQRYVLGLSEGAEFDSSKASMSSFLAFYRDEDGNAPTVGTFSQQSMEPHLSQFKLIASAFAGETGLTMDDLGFVTDNPTSAESIKASHETLRLTARKAQRTFGSGFMNVGYLAACLRDNYAFSRRAIYELKPHWAPIFEPDAVQMSGIGDAAIKINQAVPGYFDRDNIEKLTGITGGEPTEDYSLTDTADTGETENG
ncbi:MAG: hypothetical protein ACOX8B_08645 [Lachnospiraceae bacterium]|jgi:hypothetical protein